MIVCQCAATSCADVRRAADQGARTLAQVCGATGAGRDCGSCVFTLKRILCEHQAPVVVDVVEVEGAAS